MSAIFIDYGQAAAVQERRAAKRVARFFGIPLTICEAHGPAKLQSGELRARNMFLIAAALLLGNCKPGVVTIGIHAGTAYYDCSAAFYEIASRFVAEQTSGTVQLIAPLLDWRKSEIVDGLRKARFPFKITYSCEAGGELSCGKCLSCLDRLALNI